MTFSEIIPRRNSCQILSIEREKERISKNWKKKFQQIMPKHIYFLFSLLNSKLNSSPNFCTVTVPFGLRIILKKTCIISKNAWKIKKKKIFQKITKKKSGKILSSNEFEKKIKNFNFGRQVYKKFFFFLEEKNKKNNIRKLQKIFHLCQQSVFNLKIGKNPLLNLIQALSRFWIKLYTSPVLSIKINGKNCSKKIKNNLSQIFGAIIDCFPGGVDNIQKVSLKFKNSISFTIDSNLNIL